MLFDFCKTGHFNMSHLKSQPQVVIRTALFATSSLTLFSCKFPGCSHYEGIENAIFTTASTFKCQNTNQ